MRLRFKIVPAVIFLFIGAIIYAGENMPVKTFGSPCGAGSFAVTGAVQKDDDSLVTLIQANSAKLVDVDGKPYREIVGDATFLHNNTYLKCDFAMWDVTENIIRASGNVQVIQENTFLTGDNIDYIIDSNLAKVTGSLVELYDKDHNILRTTAIDYYTKDSLGFFERGGAMQSSDGNIMESLRGYYVGKEKRFSFQSKVEVFVDSAFISSDKIDYYTETQLVKFGDATTGWKDDNMLFANRGTYDRGTTLFNLTKNGYVVSAEQEIWGDDIMYNRTTGYAEINGNAQVLDTVQKVIMLADLATVERQPYANVLLTRKPALAMYSVENGKRDTLFMRADTIKYYKIPLSSVDSIAVAASAERRRLMALDPLTDIDKEAAIKNPNRKRTNSLEAPVAAGNALKGAKDENGVADERGVNGDSLGIGRAGSVSMQVADSGNVKVTDSLSVRHDTLDMRQQPGSLVVRDSLAVKDSLSVRDSLSVKDSLAVADSVAVVADTVLVTFVEAYHKIGLHRNDIQAVADSLIYTNLDSIARFYVKPILWSDTTNQVTSDSMQVLIVDNALKKANFLSNAFIATQEDSVHFNQIKSTEMMAYFNNNDIYRFDALGGVTSAFYLQEDSIFTSINLEESKLMTARFKNRELQHVRSISEVKSDVKPLFNLPIEEQRLRGFEWHDTLRPKSRKAITERVVKRSDRERLERTPFPTFRYSERFFKERRDSILDYKHRTDSLIAANKAERLAKKQSRQLDSAAIYRDSTLQQADSLRVIDSLANSRILKTDETDSVRAVSNKDSLDLAGLSVEERVEMMMPQLSDEQKSSMSKREIRRYMKKKAKLTRQLKREERRKFRALARENRRKDRNKERA